MSDPKITELFWEGVHQLLAHPLMFLSFRSKWADLFHDYTANKAGFK